jgi:hypothetical protein
MSLKPLTFKIEGDEIEAIEREAKAAKVPRSEYVRDIVKRRNERKLPRPNRGDKE